jgi:spore coat polysaccharide biosynthesis protein SpsF
VILEEDKIAIISQARMTSSRLPGKVLLKVAGRQLLDYHFSRLARSGLPVILATSNLASDDVLAKWAEERSLPFYRGAEDDVLSRFYEAANKFHLDHIIRVTSDCPLLDGELIALAAKEYLALGSDRTYFSNCQTRTFPRGFDFEIFSFKMLAEANRYAVEVTEREHVTPYFYRSHSGEFLRKDFLSGQNRSNLRVTVDQQEDFELIEKLIRDHGAAEKSYREIVEIFDRHPELARINRHVEQKKVQGLLFRPATTEDEQWLHLWGNDSGATSRIVIAGGQREIWIAEHEGHNIGWLCRNRAGDDQFDLAWAVSPEQRGLGYGNELLQSFIREFPAPLYTVRISTDDVASMKMAIRAGFVAGPQVNGFIQFTRG